MANKEPEPVTAIKLNCVKNILERYEIKYSANDEMGVFESTTLKGIYDNLLDKGSKTMIDALIVGATVEDLDINDLNNLIKETDNVELLNLYNNLRSGSIKHLNSFIKQIEKNNSKYTPQYISQEEFDNIVIR